MNGMKRHSVTRAWGRSLLASVAVVVGTAPAAARDHTPATELEAIVVSGTVLGDDGRGAVDGYLAKTSRVGTKTSTPLSKVAQSISVVGSKQISDQGSTTVMEALRYTPGVRSDSYGADQRNEWFLMRGFVGETSGMFLDELQLTTYGFATWKMDPWLLERVEVVRGPSSVLYGGSTPGGILNMVSKRPTGQSGGEAFTTVNSHGHVTAGVDVETSDEEGVFSARFVGLGAKGATEVDFSDNDRLAIAPSIIWSPTDETRLEIYGNYQRMDTNGQNFLPYVGTVVDAPIGRIPRDFFSSDPAVDEHLRRQGMVGYRFEHSFDNGLTVRQNARYGRVAVDFTTLYGAGWAPPTDGRERLNRYWFGRYERARVGNIDTQAEFALSTGAIEHTILAGVDYRVSRHEQAGFWMPAPPIDVVAPIYREPLKRPTPQAEDTTTNTQLGVYLQDQMEFGAWNAVLGGRYDTVWSRWRTPQGAQTRGIDGAFSGRAGLMYHFDNGVSPYVSVSSSFVPAVGTDTVTGRPFEPETGLQYEAGAKITPAGLDNTSINLSVFDLTRNNVATGDGLGNYRQLGEARSRGLEMEAIAELTPSLSLIGAYTWYDMKITDGTPDEIGKLPTGVPQQFGSLWVNYAFTGEKTEGLSVGGGVRWMGKSFADVKNTLVVPSYTVVDGALRYEKERFSLALNVNNLFDEQYVGGCASPTACYYGKGREFQLTLSTKW